MNHIQMFRYVQENTTEFSYEVRSLMRTINNELNLEKMKSDLILLLNFTQQKINDEKEMEISIPGNNTLLLLGEKSIEYDNEQKAHEAAKEHIDSLENP